MKNTVPFLLSLSAAVGLMIAACAPDGGTGQNNGPLGTSGTGAGGDGGQVALQCTAPQVQCGGSCVDTSSNSAHCNGCNNACPPGSMCSGSQCVCAPGFDVCNLQCTDTSSNAQHCGGCGNVCPGTAPFCSAGACVATCGVGQLQCGTSCVDGTSNVQHCGMCNKACPAGTSCSGGMCGCANGLVPCNGACVAAGTCAVTPTGGAGNGGNGTGGTPPTAGTTSGGEGGTQNTAGTTSGAGTTSMAGTTSGGGDPPGFWRQDDWFGCSWTGIDDKMAGTTITPQDFVGGLTDGAFCVSGTVAAVELWEGVALLGFNLAEDPATADCTYTPVDTTAEGPPGVIPTEAGLAVNFVKRGDTGITLRVQIQGPDGGKAGEVGAADRWCYTLQAAQGKEFIPWDAFNKECWETELDPALNYAMEDISAVVFAVPSNGWPEGESRPTDVTDTPFEFCVNGFAAGATADDAPEGSAVAGEQSGTVGANGADYDRAKVTVDGEDYIIQNNNWGNEAGELVLSYKDNSFKITSGSGNGGTAPASFPSIFIGGNGFTMGGALSTSRTDNLPIPIANITSAQTTFRWSGSTSSFNAAYDVWFADPSRPLNGSNRYNDGLDAFLMVWLHDPGGNSASPQPIGSQVGTANIAGVNWYVWVGPRGSGDTDPDADIHPDGSAPVVSYVAPSDMTSFSFDLKDFITDATGRSGGGSKAFASNLLLTDVFAGFEIWSGGAGGNLGVDEFTIKVEGNR